MLTYRHSGDIMFSMDEVELVATIRIVWMWQQGYSPIDIATYCLKREC